MYKISVSTYASNGRTAVRIKSPDGIPLVMLSTNVEHVPDLELKQGEFIVKTWSENKPYADITLYNGRFEDTGRRVDVSMFCKNIPIWRLATRA